MTSQSTITYQLPDLAAWFMRRMNVLVMCGLLLVFVCVVAIPDADVALSRASIAIAFVMFVLVGAATSILIKRYSTPRIVHTASLTPVAVEATTILGQQVTIPYADIEKMRAASVPQGVQIVAREPKRKLFFMDSAEGFVPFVAQVEERCNKHRMGYVEQGLRGETCSDCKRFEPDTENHTAGQCTYGTGLKQGVLANAHCDGFERSGV